jgi:hypothetical protein
MSNTNTGGPAFPHTVEYKGADCGGVVPHGGMSLRDYFAANALQGLMGRVWGNQPAEELFSIWAKSAYAVADAMLKARAQ